MDFAKLIVFQPGHEVREVEIVHDRISIGRALDNAVSLDGDTNVSRYHAEIEKRGDDYYLIDLDSSNGTTVNDEVISDEILRNEDLICIGGSTLIEFYESDSPWELSDRDESRNEPAPVAVSLSPSASDLPVAQSPSPETPPVIQSAVKASDGKTSPLVIALGVVAGLLLVGVVAFAIHRVVSPKCNPTVRIVNPLAGTTIREPTTIRVEVEDQQCIDRLIYQIDGRKLMSVDYPPYEVTIDPRRLQDLDPGTHNLSVTVEDKEGKKLLQPGAIVIAFETTAAPPAVTPGTKPAVAAAAGASDPGSVSIEEIRELCIGLAKEFRSSKSNYKYDKEFLEQVQARTSEYARQGFFERARRFRDPINSYFIDQKNLDEPLGYVLAMSRSNFVMTTGQGRSEDSRQGLWQMSQSAAERIGYTGGCGTETISDPSQRCAALVAATHAKALVTVALDGDFVYGVACFSMGPKEAGTWAAQLPQERSDFWKVIRSPEQRDLVVRFFAAGIVGENPEKFNLQDRKLSSLYPKR